MFKALYRKYRPTNFSDVVGQTQTVKILKNAIQNNKITHAYLFYGPRGTGKTSLAKIFANEINKNQIYLSDSVDIIEIDAASNNGVDEIRDIKENIKFLPNEGNYKVYIIDEVHMLTTSAFNALLKTLEEPPSHIIFILATTEFHKIPATILSRCQKFEFKNLTVEELNSRLEYISKQEGIAINKEAVQKISLVSKGGLRDAIGILEQLSSYTDKEIILDDVLEITASISETELLEFYNLLLKKDSTSALLKYNDFLTKSKDTKLLINDLINISKDCVIYKNINKIEFCQYNVEILKDEVEKIDYNIIYKIIDELSVTENRLRFSSEYISYMQICIMRITSILDDKNKRIVLENDKNNLGIDTEQIIELNNKIKKLEDKILLLEEKNAYKIENKEKPKDFIIPNKNKILNIITNSDNKFIDYAKNTLIKILNDYFKNDKEVYEILNGGKLIHSSKQGCIILFSDHSDIIRLISTDNYKERLEFYFSKMLGVNYSVNVLQKSQYEYLLNSNNEEIIENKTELNDEKKVQSKIEDIFFDIIKEK